MGGFNSSKQSQQASQGATQSVWDQQVPYLQQLFSQASSMAGQPSQIAQPAFDAWGQAVSGQINPGVGQVIDNASREMGLQFNREVMPALRNNAIGAGALGGSRQGIAEGLAAGELARAQGNMASNMTMQATDQARQQQLGALGMSGLIGNLPWQNVQNFGQAIGGPTVLGESWGQSSGKGSSMGASVGKK